MTLLFSKTIKSGRYTYFVDVQEGKKSARFITITENSITPALPGGGGTRKLVRKSIMVQGNACRALSEALADAAAILT